MRYVMPTLAVGALLFSIAIFLVVVSPGSAHLDTTIQSKYTYGSTSCGSGNRVDPLNVVFYNWGTWGRAESQIQYHASWTNSGGSTQYFSDHGGCFVMHTQRASGSVTSARYHIRVRGQHQDPSLNWVATGDAHHEDYVASCLPSGWHAVDSNGSNGSGFDQGRAQLSNAMSMGGHTYYYSWWGNTQNFQQCDGDMAGSDGVTSFISLHQVNH